MSIVEIEYKNYYTYYRVRKMYSNSLVLDILDYIEDNINMKITIDDISRNIMRTFKRELNMTISDYINKKRIYNSLDELKNSDHLILKIALNNGFSSIEYFCETFNKVLGVNPNTFRKFTKVNSKISEDDYNLIRKNLPELVNIINKTQEYRKNIPTVEVKSLSLFEYIIKLFKIIQQRNKSIRLKRLTLRRTL